MSQYTLSRSWVKHGKIWGDRYHLTPKRHRATCTDSRLICTDSAHNMHGFAPILHQKPGNMHRLTARLAHK